MSRLFDGTDDQAVFATVPAAIAVNGAHTMLIVVRVLQTSETVWLSFIETETSGAADSATLGRSNAGEIYWANGASFNDAITLNDSTDAWVVAAVTKTAGSSVPRSHKVILSSNTPTHTNFPGNESNAPSITGGTIRIGGNADFANIRVAAAAIFNKVLSDGEIEGIGTAKTTKSIYDLTPVWLVDDNAADGFSTDYMGNLNRSSLTGTTDDADDPSGWVYGIGAASATSLLWNPARYALTKR